MALIQLASYRDHIQRKYKVIPVYKNTGEQYKEIILLSEKSEESWKGFFFFAPVAVARTQECYYQIYSPARGFRNKCLLHTYQDISRGK